MLSGAEVTLFSDKTGNRSIQTEPAEGGFMPKAMVKVPSGDFVRIVYPITFEDGSAEKIIELFSLATVRDVVAASGGMKAEAQGGMSAMGGQMQMPMGGQMQMPMNGQMQVPMGGQMQVPMGGQMQMPGYGMQGGGGHYQTPNVQQVQFGNLMGGQGHQEAGNIGLIMDVYMELTVEIGRTKKPIKEILGFGEGTIIELDKLAGENVDVLVNHKLIAKGEVVVIDESFGVRITEIVSPMERMADMT
jgi:flagellar motor switch protein FliN/FliY